jgi:hypothetical protein
MWGVPKLTGLFTATKGFMHMSQTWHSNGFDSRDNQQGDNSQSCGVLEHVNELVDPAMLLQDNNDVVAREQHIVLSCGPQDDDDDDE